MRADIYFHFNKLVGHAYKREEKIIEKKVTFNIVGKKELEEIKRICSKVFTLSFFLLNYRKLLGVTTILIHGRRDERI